MQENPISDPAERERITDQAVMALLLDPDYQRPWSEAEMVREIGEEARDSLARLGGHGLVHRAGGFVWASRAAIKGATLAD